MEIKTNATVIPARIRPGDCIGVVAPASPFDRAKFERGIAVLHSMGFQTAVPDGLYTNSGYLAGPDQLRADLINRFFSDGKIKAIVCARGGFGSMRILPLLDYATICRHPKIFTGFSDVSALLAALNARCGLVTLHGPVVTSLADADHSTRKALLDALVSDSRIEIRSVTGITLHPGTASGPVVGGNLTTLCHLVGTPFAPNLQGKILLLEDTGEAVYRIDRMVTHMKLAGFFRGLAGLVLGSFLNCGKINEIYHVVDNTFKGEAIPILAGVKVGHEKCNITVPIGLKATLDADRKVLSFHEPATLPV